MSNASNLTLALLRAQRTAAELSGHASAAYWVGQYSKHSHDHLLSEILKEFGRISDAVDIIRAEQSAETEEAA